MGPFTDYVKELSVRGQNYELSVLETEINIGLDDMLEILANPSVNRTSEQRWHDFSVIAYRKAKKQFRLNVVMPIIDGQFTWDNKVKKVILQQQESM